MPWEYRTAVFIRTTAPSVTQNNRELFQLLHGTLV